MKRPKMRRRTYYADDATAARIRAQARAHGVSESAWIRSLAAGHRAGAEPGNDAAAADAWWDSRKPARRVSIFRNHSAARDDVDDKHQLTIFDEGTDQ